MHVDMFCFKTHRTKRQVDHKHPIGQQRKLADIHVYEIYNIGIMFIQFEFKFVSQKCPLGGSHGNTLILIAAVAGKTQSEKFARYSVF